MPDSSTMRPHILAEVVGLVLPQETVSGVRSNLELLEQLARTLDDVPLDDSRDEPAPVFVPR